MFKKKKKQGKIQVDKYISGPPSSTCLILSSNSPPDLTPSLLSSQTSGTLRTFQQIKYTKVFGTSCLSLPTDLKVKEVKELKFKNGRGRDGKINAYSRELEVGTNNRK